MSRKILLVSKEKFFVASITQFNGKAGCFALFCLLSFAFSFVVFLSSFHLQQQCWWPELLWSRPDWSASLCIALLPPIWRISVFTLSLANVILKCMIFDLVNLWYWAFCLLYLTNEPIPSINPKSHCKINISSNQIISFLTFHSQRH